MVLGAVDAELVSGHWFSAKALGSAAGAGSGGDDCAGCGEAAGGVGFAVAGASDVVAVKLGPGKVGKVMMKSASVHVTSSITTTAKTKETRSDMWRSILNRKGDIKN